MSGLRAALRGGCNYGEPSESFPVSSLRVVRDMWADRERSNGHRTCDDVDAYGEVTRWFYPCWGDRPWQDAGGSWVAAEVWVVPTRETFEGFDPETDDPFGQTPDYRLLVGPRGGLRWERCY